MEQSSTPASSKAEERLVERVLCYSTLLDDNKKNTSLFRHPIFSYAEELKWPPPHWEELHCWHCCSKLKDPPVPLAQEVDLDTGRYAVYGLFCGFPCAKGYIFESQPWSAGDKLLLLEDMAAAAFGSQSPIMPAPPRQRLRMFGGDLSIEEFHGERHVYTVCNPPLISFPETYEREVASSAAGAAEAGVVRGLRIKVVPETQPTRAEDLGHASQRTGVALASNPYTSFCQRTKPTDDKNAPRRVARDEPSVPGTLSAFMKKPKPKAPVPSGAQS